MRISEKVPRRRRVTLQAVADLAGVNRVTAAVALGRSPHGGTRVSNTTRQRILAAAQQLGYAPNVLAQALRGERTNIIGYYAGYEALDAHTPFTAAILQGLQRNCRAHQQDLVLFGSFERDTVESIYATLTGGKIDGLVIMPTPRSPIMDRLFDSHLPVVAIANAHPAVPSVVVDDEASGELIAQYLAEKGHRHILYRSHEEPRVSVFRRQASFLAAAHRYDLHVVVTYSQQDHELSASEGAILSQSTGQRPTAAVCWTDLNAYALLAACEQLGLRVPQELAIIGFDGIPMRIRPERQLTTIVAPWVEVAAIAVDQLFALLAGQPVPPEISLPVTLHHGDTA